MRRRCPGRTASPGRQDDRAGGLVVVGGLVDPLAGQGVVDVGQSRDSPGQRDLLARQPAGIASAVETLVVGQGDVAGHGEELRLGVRTRRRLQRFAADQRVPLHDLELVRREPPGFSSTRSGMPTLPMSCSGLVEDRSGTYSPSIGRDTIPSARVLRPGCGNTRESAPGGRRFLVARFGQLGQREDHQVAALQRKHPLAGAKPHPQFLGLEGLGEEVVGPGAPTLDHVGDAPCEVSRMK